MRKKNNPNKNIQNTMYFLKLSINKWMNDDQIMKNKFKKKNKKKH